jgi:type IV pilus assembly protein PilV
MKPFHSRSRGFSLLEVLIALLIFSFGLMGLAALQSFSVKNNQSSSLRSQATLLAYQIIDAMRANRPAVQTGYYFTDYTETACQDEDPSAATTAETDLEVWRNNLACALPDGQGKLEFPENNRVIVKIKWTDARWAIDPDQRNSEFEVDTVL